MEQHMEAILSHGHHRRDITPPQDGHSPTFITVTQLAELLQLSDKAIYEAIRNDEIPGVMKIGRVYRINLEAVLTAARQGRVPTSRKE